MLAHPNAMVIGMVDVVESEGTSLSHGHTGIGCHVLAANAPGVAVLDCREYGWCCNWLHAHAGWGTGEAVTGIMEVAAVLEYWVQQEEIAQLLACVHTCRNSSTRLKTNAPFLASSNFIYNYSLAVQQLFPGPTFYMC